MIGIAIAAGAAVSVGILCLYHGLAVGRMGVVAPVTGLLAAVIPVVFGILRDGLPPATVLAGIVIALAAVVLVSRVEGAAGSRSGLELALAAGAGIGAFNILVGELPDGSVFVPLVVIKLTAMAVIVAIVAARAWRLAGRGDWRLPGRLLPVAIAGGVFDMAGNALYVLATQAGRLDIAATLSSLYPVTTILLAMGLLGERVTRSHALGIAAAIVAIVLIGTGADAA
jgi:drug/metabolite transporter (DMT)-like permease